MPPSKSVRPQVTAIRFSLRRPQRALDQLAATARQLELAAATNGAPARRKLTLTPQRRTQLKLQGQYMGYMRQLKPRQKAQVRAAVAGGLRARESGG